MQLHTDPKPHQRGFALVVVLWLGILLALIGAVFANSVRSTLRDTASRANRLEAQALSDAGVRIAMLGLMNPDPNAKYAPRYRASDFVMMCTVPAAGVLRIEIEDDEGKINLNTSNDALLTALFSGLGASDQDARVYTSKILDFRDADDDRRTDGAERDDYAKSNTSALRPKNADFVTIAELDQVLGIPPDIRERAKPFLTTLSQQNGIDQNRMPPGLGEVLERGTRATATLSSTEGFSLPTKFLSVSTRRGFTVRSEAFLPSGARYATEAVVLLPDAASATPQVRRWQQTASRLKEPPAPLNPSQLPPC